MLRGPFWGSRATADRLENSSLKHKGAEAWPAGDPGSPTSEDHASSSTTAWHVLGDTWQEPDAAGSQATSSSTSAASPADKGSRAAGKGAQKQHASRGLLGAWLPGGSMLSALALLGAVCCAAAAVMGSGMVLGTLVGWVYVPPSLTLSRPLQLDFSGPKGAAAALLPLVRPLPRPSSFLPWRSQPSSSLLFASDEDTSGTSWGDSGDLTYNQIADTETWDALQPDPWQPPPQLLPAPPRPTTQQQLLVSGSGAQGPLLPRNPLRRWRRRRQGAGGGRSRPPSRMLSSYSSFGRGGSLAPEAVPADAPPGMTWLLPAGAAVGVGLEVEVAAEGAGRGMYQVVAELLDADGGVLGRGVATHQPRRTSWLRRWTVGALLLPWDLLGLAPDTTTTSFTLFPRYREGGLLPGEEPLDTEATTTTPGQDAGQKQQQQRRAAASQQARKPHAAWLRVKLVGRGLGGGPGLPQVFGARATFRLQPGLLGWLAAQVRPGLLSGTLLLALGAALVGGGTAGAALLAGGAYLAASTASEAAAAQQEAAQSPPGASQDTGSAASSSSRGPVAGTAAWLQHKLGKGSDVEGSSGDSSTPATPQQQLNQLAGGALGKGAWAGTPAGAPGVGDTQQEEEAEQDEGGGSSDLISSIITGRTSDPGTNASSHPAQGGSSPGTSRWFDAELGAAAANSTSSSGVHSRGVGAIAALVEAEGGGHKPPASVSAGSASEAPGQARSDSASASETLLRGSPQKAEMRPVTKRLGFCFRP